MPIALRSPNGTSTVDYGTRTNTTVNRPSGATTDDLIVVAMTCGGSTLVQPSAAAGWTLLGRVTYSAPDPWAVDLALWAKPDDGAASWTWTHDSRSTQAFAMALTGVDLANFADVAATTASGSGTTATAPALTTVTDAAWQIIARGAWDGTAITPPTGWTEHYDAPVLWVGTREQATAGPTGDVAVPAGNNGAYPWGIIHAAIRPAGAGGGTTHSIASTGTGATDGTATLHATLALSSTGTGASDGSVALRQTLMLTATGSGQTDGSAPLGMVFQIAAVGSGSGFGGPRATSGSCYAHMIFAPTFEGISTTDGTVALDLRNGLDLTLTATGTGSTDGTVALTLRSPLDLRAAGEGVTDGSITTTQKKAIGSVAASITVGSLALRMTMRMPFSGSGQTGGSVALSTYGVRQITTTGHSYSGGSVVLSEPLWRFSPPAHEEPFRTRTAPLHYHGLDYAKTVLKVGGAFIAIRTPDPRLTEGLTEGVDWFRGGFEYEVTRAVSDELQAAGFSTTPI